MRRRPCLLDALRKHLGLTGSKKDCDQGTYGACTVWVDGRRVLACLTLAVTCEGHQVTTIEGLSDGSGAASHTGVVHRTRRVPVRYCTPGQIISAVALLEEGHAGDDAEIAEWMSGNICRCAAYPNIRAAIAMVQARQDSALLAGGTTEVALARQDVLRPGLLLDINDLPPTEVADLPGGGLFIGALARMSDMARSADVVARFPVISQALQAGASAQLRNMASMGGYLCQRVRCSYFHDAYLVLRNIAHWPPAAIGAACGCVISAALVVAMASYADGVQRTRATPYEWITTAALSYAGAGIILHVASCSAGRSA
jgi:xanthine dehydrogenase YagT iron-sulfur-binding subunit